MLDYLVILAWMALVGLIGFMASLAMNGYPDYLGMFGPVGTQMIFFFVLTFPVGMYMYLSESRYLYATLGKRKVGIQVVGSEGSLASKKSILVRTIVKLLPWEIAHTCMWQMQYVFYTAGYDAEVPAWIMIGLSLSMLLVGVYIAMIVLRLDRRGPHDILAGTQVVARVDAVPDINDAIDRVLPQAGLECYTTYV